MADISGPNLETPRKGTNPTYSDPLGGNGKTGVGNQSPGTVSPSTDKGSPAVKNFDANSVSVGKNPASMSGVNLGTTYGKDSVAHRISGNQNHGPGQNPHGNTA